MTAFTPPRIRWSAVALTMALLLTIACFAGCQTQVPPPVNAGEVAFDGGVQNAGIVAFNDTGAIITPAKRNYYNSLIAIYGDAKWTKGGLPIFAEPLKRDTGISPSGENYHIDFASLSKLTLMHQWFKAGRTPQ